MPTEIEEEKEVYNASKIDVGRGRSEKRKRVRRRGGEEKKY